MCKLGVNNVKVNRPLLETGRRHFEVRQVGDAIRRTDPRADFHRGEVTPERFQWRVGRHGPVLGIDLEG